MVSMEVSKTLGAGSSPATPARLIEQTFQPVRRDGKKLAE